MHGGEEAMSNKGVNIIVGSVHPGARSLAREAVELFEALDLGDRSVKISDGPYWGEIRIEIHLYNFSCVLYLTHYEGNYKVYSPTEAVTAWGSTPLEAMQGVNDKYRAKVNRMLAACDIQKKVSGNE